MLDRARHAETDVELRGDGLAGLADLARVREPAGVDDGAGGANGGAGAECGGKAVGDREVLGVAEAAATGDEDLCVLDVDVSAALLAADLQVT